MSFGEKTRYHTCIETRGRIPNVNKSRLPEAVLKNDDLWCLDLLNLPAAPSFEGNIHCLLIIDAWSSCRTALFAPIKNGVIAQLARYLLWHLNFTEMHPMFFQMDGAGELKGAEIDALMEKHHISRRYSEAYDARANGRAENLWTWQSSTCAPCCTIRGCPPSSGHTP